MKPAYRLLRKRLIGLLYDLMRDAVPVGEIERMVREAEKIAPRANVKYTHEHLRDHAISLVERLEKYKAPQ